MLEDITNNCQKPEGIYGILPHQSICAISVYMCVYMHLIEIINHVHVMIRRLISHSSYYLYSIWHPDRHGMPHLTYPRIVKLKLLMVMHKLNDSLQKNVLSQKHLLDMPYPLKYPIASEVHSRENYGDSPMWYPASEEHSATRLEKWKVGVDIHGRFTWSQEAAN